MRQDRFIRTVLWVSVAFNICGTMAFVFPATVGQLSGFPVPVPRLYSWILALMVLMFGVAYAWLALQPQIDRPLLALGAISKTAVFCVFATCWILGDIPFLGIVGASGDLVLAASFAWWLVNDS